MTINANITGVSRAARRNDDRENGWQAWRAVRAKDKPRFRAAVRYLAKTPVTDADHAALAAAEAKRARKNAKRLGAA